MELSTQSSVTGKAFVNQNMGLKELKFRLLNSCDISRDSGDPVGYVYSRWRIIGNIGYSVAIPRRIIWITLCISGVYYSSSFTQLTKKILKLNKTQDKEGSQQTQRLWEPLYSFSLRASAAPIVSAVRKGKLPGSLWVTAWDRTQNRPMRVWNRACSLCR